MNVLRIVLNGVLAVFCVWGGAYLLWQESYFLHDRWHPETGTYFSGVSLYLLAAGLFLLGAFAAAVALAWLRGTIPMPGRRELRPHPAYKGQILVRFWYLVVPALVLIPGSFLLADKVPNPSLSPALQSGAVLPALDSIHKRVRGPNLSR